MKHIKSEGAEEQKRRGKCAVWIGCGLLLKRTGCQVKMGAPPFPIRPTVEAEASININLQFIRGALCNNLYYNYTSNLGPECW